MRVVIALTQLRYDVSQVIDLIRLSRQVARWNGNQNWDAPLHLLTDSEEIAQSSLEWHNITPSFAAQNVGICWPTPGVIWIRPDGDYTPLVMAHEMAHILTRGEHGRPWRRMYLMLAPLWQDALAPAGPQRSAFFEAMHVVRFYGQHNRRQEEVGMTGVAHARYREILSLERSAQRSVARWKKS
jgi:hypothetical protein